jgi:hypothetical protein
VFELGLSRFDSLPKPVRAMYASGAWPSRLSGSILLYWIPLAAVEAGPRVLTEWGDDDKGAWVPMGVLEGIYAS